MRKSDLKDGMVCETRNGKRYLWLNGGLAQSGVYCDGIQEDLTNDIDPACDIVKVYEMMENVHTFEEILRYPGKLIWARIDPTPKEMTLAEIENALGYPVKIVK